MLKVGTGVHETDVEWEKWGVRDPYFGVLTHDRYRSSSMTADDYTAFFESGREHVREVIDRCRHYVGESFRPARVLDFGCGVGRVLVPFAERCESVVGVDVSEAMLAELRRNCARFGVGNATLVKGDDTLSGLEGRFDLVHSTIVFQHIESERGLDLFARLVGLAAPGGVVAIHVTYGRAYGRVRYGRPVPEPSEPPQPPRSAYRRLRTAVGGVVRAALRIVRPPMPPEPEPVVATEPAVDPVMMMYHYDLSRIAYILHAAGATRFHAEFTDHGGELGAMLYAQVGDVRTCRSASLPPSTSRDGSAG